MPKTIITHDVKLKKNIERDIEAGGGGWGSPNIDPTMRDMGLENVRSLTFSDHRPPIFENAELVS